MLRRRPADRARLEHTRAQLQRLLDISSGAAGAGERVLYTVVGSHAFETRTDPGYWAAGTKGVAAPAGDVRLELGRLGGHYVPTLDTPTMLDRGTTAISDRRVVFTGTWYRREWAFASVEGVTHFVNQPWTVIELTGAGVGYGFTYAAEEAAMLRLVLTAAGAIYDGQAARLQRSLQRQLAVVSARLQQGRPMPGGVA